MTRSKIKKGDLKPVKLSLLEQAREIIDKLGLEEREQLRKELGASCSVCKGVVKQAIQHPGAAVGALLGGLVGAAISSSNKVNKLTGGEP